MSIVARFCERSAHVCQPKLNNLTIVRSIRVKKPNTAVGAPDKGEMNNTKWFVCGICIFS